MGFQRTGLLPEALRVGFPEIDEQHEEVFARLESLKGACFGSNDLPVADFVSLVNAIAQHFAAEEWFAEQANVEFSQHAMIHRDNLKSMRNALDVALNGLSNPYSFLRFIEFWFERHIVEYDQPFASNLQFGDQYVSAKDAADV
jgi:hemerythrin-like metal-binding protein